MRVNRLILTLAVSAFTACSDGPVVGAVAPPTSSGVATAGMSDTADPATPLLGVWRGTSICTPVRPACHDEIAVYHIAPSPKPNTIAMTMNKVVNGEEVEMGGTVEYHVDYPMRTLTYEMASRDGTKGMFTFTWSGKKMTGELIQLPGREVVRNIVLAKD